MTGPLNRRAALGAFASVPALAVLPVAALASTSAPTHPDAALLALQPAIDAADRELDVALEALGAAQNAYFEQARREGPDHEREVERLKTEYGVTAAYELEDAAHETVSQTQADLIDTPAKTLAGLIFKARYAATHYSDDYDEEVMVSIIDDLLAMADHPEEIANGRIAPALLKSPVFA
jgi:hypothetical protein